MESNIKKYHIVFYIEETDYVAEGRNYDGVDPIDVYTQWRLQFPTATFYALYIMQRN